MTTAFLNALNQAPKTPEKTPQSKVGSAPTSIMDIAEGKDLIRVRVAIVDDANRLDVFFSRKPDAMVLADLRSNGFQWHRVNRCWYHKDTQENRDFLNLRFQAGLEPKTSPVIAPESTETLVPYIQLSPKSEPIPDDASPEWSEHRRKVNALIESGIACGDLLLLAVDALYEKTFKEN